MGRQWNKNEWNKMEWEEGVRSRYLSDTETYPRASALSLVVLELGEIRVPWAGMEQKCLRGKGVTSGESWGVASRLCQAGSHWHNWKSDSCAWMPDGKQA